MVGNISPEAVFGSHFELIGSIVCLGWILTHIDAAAFLDHTQNKLLGLGFETMRSTPFRRQLVERLLEREKAIQIGQH